METTDNLKEIFLEKYPGYGCILDMFEKANRCKCTFRNITKLRLSRFVDYMQNVVAKSSARQYAAKFKAVLNTYSEEYNFPDYRKILTLKNEKPVNIWLTEDELNVLSAYRGKNENEELIRKQFLIGSYTGARHSDYINFDRNNIVGGMLQYVSKKTKICAIVPVKPIVSILIEEQTGRQLSDMSFNTIIRKICKDAGINERVKIFKAGKEIVGEKWRFVTSHSARRSFATNLYLRDADIYSISKMMGHSSTNMTEGYICCGIRNFSKEVEEFFT